MIDKSLKYSTVFSTENEYDAFFLKKKQSIVKRFSFTIEREVEKVYLLAYWLHIFGRNEEAIIVCNFLSQKEYDGNNSIWYHIEHAIGLKFVIEKQMGEYTSEHFNYINRIVYAKNKNIELRAKNEIDINAYKEIIDRLAVNGLALIGIQESTESSAILDGIKNYLNNFESSDDEEITERAYELGSLLGNTIQKHYGWKWFYIEVNSDSFYCIASNKERACCTCHNYIYSILKKQHSNNVKLLFNMIKKDYPKEWHFISLS